MITLLLFLASIFGFLLVSAFAEVVRAARAERRPHPGGDIHAWRASHPAGR